MRTPHPTILLYCIVLCSYALTWILPSGTFQTEVDETGTAIVIPGSFEILEEDIDLPIWTIVTVIPKGLAEAQGIIFFVLIMGGFLAVIRSTGAIDAGIGWVVRKYENSPMVLIATILLAFAAGASTYGMSEEKIPLTLILITLCIKLRMDAVVAVGLIIIGGGIGYGAAAINPFTVIVAQDIAGLPLLSGMTFRLVIFVPFLLIGFYHLWRYANKVRKDPSQSLIADLEEANPTSVSELPPLTGRQAWVIGLSCGALAFLVWGAFTYHWYTTEMSAIFLGLTAVVGFVARIPVNDLASKFTEGAAELMGTALLIGVARAIAIPLEDAQVLHTLVNGLASPLANLSSELSAIGMFIMQCMLNFFIPSGSGQAFVTMPLMAPTSDVIGVSRQIAVLAYLMGDGFTNMIVPTNAVLMAVLNIANIPYSRWFKFIWPLMAQFLIVGSLVMVISVWINY